MAAQRQSNPNPARKTYRLVPADFARMLAPGTLSFVIEFEAADPATSLMVELPMKQFLEGRRSLEQLKRSCLGGDKGGTSLGSTRGAPPGRRAARRAAGRGLSISQMGDAR